MSEVDEKELADFTAELLLAYRYEDSIDPAQMADLWPDTLPSKEEYASAIKNGLSTHIARQPSFVECKIAHALKARQIPRSRFDQTIRQVGNVENI